MTADIRVERVVVAHDGRDATVLVLTLDRPEAANAISPSVSSSFCAALSEARDDGAIGAVVLTGQGERVFCAGADLKNPEGLPAEALKKSRGQALTDMLEAVIAFEKPFVCAVNGVAAGAGAMIAVLADRIVMAEGARFVLPEINIGMPTTLGLSIFTEMVGGSLAADLVLSGRSLPSDEAARRGIAVVRPSPELMDTALRDAAMFASKPSAAYAANKVWLRDHRQPLIEQYKRARTGETSP